MPFPMKSPRSRQTKQQEEGQGDSKARQAAPVAECGAVAGGWYMELFWAKSAHPLINV